MQKKIRHYYKNKYIVLTIIYALVIFIVSAIPGQSLPKFRIFGFDKLMHCRVYFGLGILLFMANDEQLKISKKNIFLLTLLIGFGYGISDEIHQLFVINRSASIYDVIADFVGVIIGAICIFKFSHKKEESD